MDSLCRLHVQLSILVYCCLFCQCPALSVAGAGVPSAVPNNAIELSPSPSYLLLVPRTFRPGQELRISATIFRLLYKSLSIRLSVMRLASDGFQETEIASANETFVTPSSRIIGTLIPEHVSHGNYSLVVEGALHPLGGPVFSNRTALSLDPRLFSAFVQFSKPVYAMGDVVRFRVIPHEFNLQVQQRLFTSVEVTDSSGLVVRRWLSPRTGARGFIDLELQLPDTSNHGEWRVRCVRETFAIEKAFTVSFNTVRSMISVNVTMPQRLSEFAFGVYGILEANHSSNVGCRGNATIRLELRRRGGAAVGSVTKEIPFFHGRSVFLFTMQEIQEALQLQSRPSDVEVKAEATVFDWQYLTKETSSAYSVIFREVADIKFIGGLVRQFKPGFPFTALLWVFQPDGRRPDPRHRRVDVTVYCNTGRQVRVESGLPVPDDSVIRFTLRTDGGCINYRLVAVLQSSGSSMARTAEQFIFRHYSATGAYLTVTTSTARPTVDRYMVFNVRTSHYAPEIHYLIQAGGSILFSDIVRMPAGVLSKTFSIALSREMAPVARIVAYFMKQDGELVTDSLSFFVELLRMSSISVTMNQGSDLSGKTVTGWVSGAAPGSFALLSAVPFDLYLRFGSRVILEHDALLDEQLRYVNQLERPLGIRWYDDSTSIPKASYFPAPALGPDANKTMNFSGLVMFTDSNHSMVSFSHSCNETLNPDRAFPCYSDSPDECYGHRHRCNGQIDCDTGVDEINCESEDLSSLPGYVEPKFQLEYRHFLYDANWLWQSVYVKPFPDGKMSINTATIPKLETSWVIGAIAVHPSEGIQVQSSPTRFTAARKFYMVLEGPPTAVLGEQIGLRVALFNRGEYWTEAVVELQRSLDFDFVSVGANGQINSYAPELLSNLSVHTMVYISAGSERTVYFPVLPRQVGVTTVTICAYSFIGGECSNVKIPVSINGISNSYSTPILLDLVDNSELMAQNLYLIPEQSFVEPDQRWRRFVPGSKAAVLTVAGDIVGPTLGPAEPFCDASCSAWKPVGSAESVLFNINRNVQVLQYLSMTSQLKTSTLDATLNYINTQYTRLSFYMDPVSGGISNFPERFSGETSAFLTAYGLFTLAEAALSEWDRVLFINPDVFGRLLVYLNATQDRSKDEYFFGSFNDEIRWDMKYFTAYINDKTVSKKYRKFLDRVPLTALVVIAAKHPRIPSALTGLAESISNRALGYLNRHLRKMSKNSLCLAMTSYALTFGGNSLIVNEAKKMLLESARTDNYLYWADRQVRPLIREPDTAGKILIKPRIEWPNEAFAVQATSFALLVLFKTGSPVTDKRLRSNITKIVNFLTETKNSPKGWISTQDTVFAVRALREVATLDLNRDIYKMQIDIRPTSDIAKSRSFVLDGANLTEPQLFKLDDSDTWGEVMVRATGSGRAVLQLYAMKSVENDFQIKNAADPVNPDQSIQLFELTCTPSYSGRNGSWLHITSCARWVWTDRSETSGMAVLSYSIPSGYLVSNYGMRNLVQSSSVRGLRHIWESGNTLNLFFTNFTSTETTCATVSISRRVPVANITVEQSCQVYEYFENNNGNFTMYSARSLHSNDICKVCGSFQCPYCPDYNGATATADGSLAVVGFACLMILLCRLRAGATLLH
ncbi:hypothetical protein BOX15_Mlig014034g1 [Macrostomum lignano]|uniref:CD109 antigen n=1 Tax=Macrostomum lignano TaxID=282301 RepID=A0A267EQL4_9PLAT|nr:hypothetical protein BOX15_Mlig014034g1 [Macrostomum lignano]